MVPESDVYFTLSYGAAAASFRSSPDGGPLAAKTGGLLLLGLESGLVGIGRTNHQLEGAAVTHSNGCEVTHIACGQTTDAERLGERYNRPIDEAQAKIREASAKSKRRLCRNCVRSA